MDTVTISKDEYEKLLRAMKSPEIISSDASISEASLNLAYNRKSILESGMYDDVLNMDKPSKLKEREKERVQEINDMIKTVDQKHFSEGATDKIEEIKLIDVLKSLQYDFEELHSLSKAFLSELPFIYAPSRHYRNLKILEEIHLEVNEFENLMNSYIDSYKDFIIKHTNMDETVANPNDRVDKKIKELNERVKKIKAVFCSLLEHLGEESSEVYNREAYLKYGTEFCKELMAKVRAENKTTTWFEKAKSKAKNLVSTVAAVGSSALDRARRIYNYKIGFLSLEHFSRNATYYYVASSIIYQSYMHLDDLVQAKSIGTADFMINVGYVLCKSLSDPIILGSLVGKMTSLLLKSVAMSMGMKKASAMFASILGNSIVFLGPILVWQNIKDTLFTLLGYVCGGIKLASKLGYTVLSEVGSRAGSLKELINKYGVNGGFSKFWGELGFDIQDKIRAGVLSVVRTGSHGLTSFLSVAYQSVSGNIKNLQIKANQTVGGAFKWMYDIVTDKLGFIKEIKPPVATDLGDLIPGIAKSGLTQVDYSTWSDLALIEQKIVKGKSGIEISPLLDLMNRASKTILKLANIMLNAAKKARDFMINSATTYLNPIWQKLSALGYKTKNYIHTLYSEGYIALQYILFAGAVHNDYEQIYYPELTKQKKRIKELKNVLKIALDEQKKYKIKNQGMYFVYQKNRPGGRQTRRAKVKLVN
uniref:Uncharacterized protein n=1 Tax=Pithovirus LCPAC001 TaxID=2506585 RepID=A0A481Z202_9VIRU|nr:MAG: hypothetical protein LCPAC001_02060 [Pithovirus LCPAC001]